ncbi:MAG: hypothetical protein HYX92_17090 [Chloroflexi bacterium]|nr:hypothetical protein [Chloroflexota bacterium]
MATAKQLYQLQEIDLDIDSRKATLSSIESQLGESEGVLEAQRRIEDKRARLKQLGALQRDEEWEAQAIQSKAGPVEKKLYGGTVRNPRELSDMQDELNQLKAQQRKHEDVILELMSQAEDLQREIEGDLDGLRRMEADWYQEQERLFRERDRIRAELSTLEETRAARAAAIDAESLALYESLRLTKQGAAVAKAERGMCQGCRISLSMNELRKAKSPQELVHCGSCGRILYVS